MSKTTTVTGTVKVGRWTYGAKKVGDTITYEKRDKDATVVEANEKVAATFVADEQPEAITGVVAPTEQSNDFRDARLVYENIFDSFAVTGDELPVEGLTEKRATELATYLTTVTVKDHAGQEIPLVVRDAKGGDNGKTVIWQSWETYDSIDTAEALRRFDEAIPTNLVVKERKIRTNTAVTNNTHKKPGKSTWKAGTPCPQGHILNGSNLYVMPSGRKQCKDCRAGYPSNI
jgi:hypothetical protein